MASKPRGRANVSAEFDLDLAALSRQVQPLLLREGARVIRRIATEARALVPVKTGNLGRSIREEQVKPTGPFRVTGGVSADAPYARYVHDGTRAHIITPRNGQFLAFPGRSGQTVFARSVRHPGTKARPFLVNAAERVVGGRVVNVK
ncbi:tail component [Tsukamurella phage TPA2]|uniref:tail component n=1 Tax=Tsukamurella phage TPA2 TaxID=981330 RepID=UPI0001FF8DB6|nr:tail component [Tsukamurella phage TPA2]ADX31945.1 tail component [Tsukamurella phage TPA2]